MKNALPVLSKSLFACLLTTLLLLSACSIPESPEKFFDIAILNTNVFNDFASPGLIRHIDQESAEFPDIPSSKKKGDEATIFVTNKVLYIEQSLEKVKKLSASGDNKDIKALSVALYELVLPVYKNEYMAYAKLCDSKAGQPEKDALAKSITEKYGVNFEQKYTSLMEKGKLFAEANNINVNWGN